MDLDRVSRRRPCRRSSCLAAGAGRPALVVKLIRYVRCVLCRTRCKTASSELGVVALMHVTRTGHTQKKVLYHVLSAFSTWQRVFLRLHGSCLTVRPPCANHVRRTYPQADRSWSCRPGVAAALCQLGPFVRGKKLRLVGVRISTGQGSRSHALSRLSRYPSGSIVLRRDAQGPRRPIARGSRRIPVFSRQKHLAVHVPPGSGRDNAHLRTGSARTTENDRRPRSGRPAFCDGDLRALRRRAT